MSDGQTNFPEHATPQQIDEYGQSVWTAERPSAWLVKSLEGTTDFGFDYHVQHRVGTEVKYTFRVQLKSTTKPRFSADGKTLSFPMARTTLNLYQQAADSTMLVVCVVPEDLRRPYEGVVYFGWIADLLPNGFDGRAIDASGQATFTLHIPVENRLTHTTDVTAYLATQLEFLRSSETLRLGIADEVSGRMPLSLAYQQFGSGVIGRPGLAAAIIENDDLWPAPPDGTAVAELRCVADKVRFGKWAAANEGLLKIQKGALTTQELAEYTYLEGVLSERAGDLATALARYEAAQMINPLRDVYLVAAVDLKFIADMRDDMEQRAACLRELEHRTSLGARTLRARILMVSDDEFALEGEVAQLPEPQKSIAKSTHALYEGRWGEVVEFTSKYLGITDTSQHQRALGHTLRARAYFQLSMGGEKVAETVPLSGPAGIDISIVHKAWSDVLAALSLMKELGWPTVVRQVADVAVGVANMLNFEEKIAPFLQGAADALPWAQELHQALESLFAHQGKYELALRSNERQPLTPMVIARRVMLLGQAGDYEGCWETGESQIALLSEAGRAGAMAIGIAAASALRCARPSVQKRLLGILRNSENLADFAAFFDVVCVVEARGESLAGAVNELRQAFREHPQSHLVAQNLYASLDERNPVQAVEIPPVAAQLRVTQQLSYNETLKLIESLLTCEDWQEAFDETQVARQRFGDTPRLVTAHCFAVSCRGDTAVALEVLDGLFESKALRGGLAQLYLDICSRLGLYEQSARALKEILGAGPKREVRIDCLRMLLLVKSECDGEVEEIEDLLTTLAALVSPKNPSEESVFLNVATELMYVRRLSLSSECRAEFESRLEMFSKAHPDESVFIKSLVLGETSSDALVEALDIIRSHVLDAKSAACESTSTLPVATQGASLPFLARASLVTTPLDSVMSFWEASKDSRNGDTSAGFFMTRADPINMQSEQFLKSVPLLDLTTLIVLHDLGRLELLLEMWSKVAIGEYTVRYITQVASKRFSPSSSRQIAVDLNQFIKTNLACILQPRAAGVVLSGAVRPLHLLSEAKALQSNGYHLVCDDIAMREALEASRQPEKSFSTLDFLGWANAGGKLSVLEVCDDLCKLLRWNVRVHVPLHFLAASLSASTIYIGELKDAPKHLESLTLFGRLAPAVFEAGKNCHARFGDLCAFVENLVVVGTLPAKLIAAVWHLWMSQIHRDHPAAGPQFMHRALAMLILMKRLKTQFLPLLWSCFLSTIELEHGERMDKALEAQSVNLLGTFWGAFSGASGSVEDSSMTTFRATLGEETEQAQWFDDGVADGVDYALSEDGQSWFEMVQTLLSFAEKSAF